MSAASSPSLKGKIVIVTGANTGIGKTAALELAKSGAHVILACRSAEKTLPCVEEIKAASNNDLIEFEQLDLASLKNIREFAERIAQKKFKCLDILVNNAGLAGVSEFATTKDGFELTVGTNHFGHFYLTLLLLPLIEKAPEAKIVNVSSRALFGAKKEHFTPLEKMNDSASYSVFKSYSISKACNVLFTKALTRRLSGKKNVYVNSLHPGVVYTDVWRSIPWYFMIPLKPLFWLFMYSPEQGALTTIYAATSPDIVEKDLRGRFFVPFDIDTDPGDVVKDETLQEELWDFSEKEIKERFGSNAFDAI
jgi:retinol dehydrogenase 12